MIRILIFHVPWSKQHENTTYIFALENKKTYLKLYKIKGLETLEDRLLNKPTPV